MDSSVDIETDEVHSCPPCGLTFKDKASFERHNQREHPSSSSDKNEIQKKTSVWDYFSIKCNECDDQFSFEESEDLMTEHLANLHDIFFVDPRVCDATSIQSMEGSGEIEVIRSTGKSNKKSPKTVEQIKATSPTKELVEDDELPVNESRADRGRKFVETRGERKRIRRKNIDNLHKRWRKLKEEDANNIQAEEEDSICETATHVVSTVESESNMESEAAALDAVVKLEDEGYSNRRPKRKAAVEAVSSLARIREEAKGYPRRDPQEKIATLAAKKIAADLRKQQIEERREERRKQFQQESLLKRLKRRPAPYNLTMIPGIPDKCRLCDKEFDDDCILVRHLRFEHFEVDHPELSRIFSREEPEPKKRERWYKGKINPVDSKKIECDICFRRFFEDSQYLLAVHREKDHGVETIIDGKLIETGKLYTICEICGQSMSRWNLTAHMFAKHRELKQYPCDFENCGKMYSRPTDLLYHRRIHQGYQVICEHCGKSFRKPPRLDEHIRRVHSNEDKNVVKCKECDKIFASISGMKQHVARDHLRVMKYQCKFCGRRFWDLGNRNKHERGKHRDGVYHTELFEENSQKDWSEIGTMRKDRKTRVFPKTGNSFRKTPGAHIPQEVLMAMEDEQQEGESSLPSSLTSSDPNNNKKKTRTKNETSVSSKKKKSTVVKGDEGKEIALATEILNQSQEQMMLAMSASLSHPSSQGMQDRFGIQDVFQATYETNLMSQSQIGHHQELHQQTFPSHLHQTHMYQNQLLSTSSSNDSVNLQQNNVYTNNSDHQSRRHVFR